MPKRKIVISGELAPSIQIKLPERLKHLDREILKYVSTKQVSFDVIEMFRNSVNRYIPTDTGNIRDNGYVILLTNNKKEPGGRLKYRNTKQVPYVMYQYVGKIWQPNYAPFTVVATPDGKVSCKWTKEWRAVKKRARHETEIKFRRSHTSKWFHVSNTGLRYKVDFYGYKNKESQPRWVEYARRANPDWERDIKSYAETVYSNAINQIAENKRKYVLRTTKGKPSKTVNEILGVKNNLRVTTRLRKKSTGD